MKTERPPLPRSLTGVIWGKILKWIEKSSASSLMKATFRASTSLLLLLAVFLPSFTLGFLTSVMEWNGFRVPIACGLLLFWLNWKRLYRLSWRLRRKSGNQHTFHTVPVAELVDFLITHRKFTRDLAIQKLKLTQGNYHKIKDTLKKHDVLIRGENNAWVLNTITRELLARQLSENFPAYFNRDTKEWLEKEGLYTQLTRANSKSEKKESAVAKIKKKIRNKEDSERGLAPSPFTSRELVVG